MRFAGCRCKQIVSQRQHDGAQRRACSVQSFINTPLAMQPSVLTTIDFRARLRHENEHSFSLFQTSMSQVVSSFSAERGLSERHIRILDAAERVFARAGFHAATMNDIAVEAAMSPGNLYRYFSSKDALIAGISERDRTEVAADFAQLDPAKGGLLDQLEELGRQHMVRKPREKAIIALQIWAEASRTPEMAQICAGFDEVVEQGLGAAVAAAKASGELPSNLDQARFLTALFMMADGFFCRRAVDPNFDAAAGAEALFAAMRGLAQTMLLPLADGQTS
ncbi:TetR/AcrR family transcriptional regulator [Bosea sp. FBZP-16]|uniref:TetR/AcrR family transcriptional regulator n=2 Tax=Bosea TaxID=85413 RepID=UPI000C305F01|nr:TetR/AcrR family transcriptional regulator [Bosea sp. FBZP-16]